MNWIKIYKSTGNDAALKDLLEGVDAGRDGLELGLDFGALSVDELNGVLNRSQNNLKYEINK